MTPGIGYNDSPDGDKRPALEPANQGGSRRLASYRGWLQSGDAVTSLAGREGPLPASRGAESAPDARRSSRRPAAVVRSQGHGVPYSGTEDRRRISTRA